MLSDRLFSYALAHTRNRDDALDLVQDTFIDLWGGLKKFKYKNDESFYGFVFLVLKRKLYRHYKKQPANDLPPRSAHRLVVAADN